MSLICKKRFYYAPKNFVCINQSQPSVAFHVETTDLFCELSSHGRRSVVFTVNFEHTLQLTLVYILLTLGMYFCAS